MQVLCLRSSSPQPETLRSNPQSFTQDKNQLIVIYSCIYREMVKSSKSNVIHNTILEVEVKGCAARFQILLDLDSTFHCVF